tara:strand:+ start:329 stop:760 length:432 start_codon:yes stop_codon:yes gene_type:complete
MTYLIFNSDNNIVKIASNNSDRDSQNMVLSNHSVVSVSDADFLKVRTNVAIATYDGTDVTITDLSDNFIESENDLKLIFKDIINIILNFSQNNQDNLLYNSLNNYKEYLENFDTSSLTFPVDKSWEHYCNENSITFYHPLQIP